MRHNRRTKRLGRSSEERQAMLENLVTSLIKHQQIKTTLPKAKEARRLAERVITLGKDNTLHAKRLVFSYLQDHALTSKVFNEVAPRFKDRKGGYTRILRLSRRKGDGVELALLELTEKEIKVSESKSKAGKKGEEKPKTPMTTKPISESPAAPKHPHGEKKQEKQQRGFFKNIAKFFRNKGGS